MLYAAIALTAFYLAVIVIVFVMALGRASKRGDWPHDYERESYRS